MNKRLIKNFGLVALVAGLCVCDQAFAAGATDVKSKLQTILDVVQACGVVLLQVLSFGLASKSPSRVSLYEM